MIRKLCCICLAFLYLQFSKAQYVNSSTLHYLALGDSYTIGEMVPPAESFPFQAVSLMQKKGWRVEVPQIIAKTGWTTDELQGAIDKAELKKQYDLVSLLIGVNNQYRGRSAPAYAYEFEALLKQAIQFAGNNPSHVIVLSIPDWGVTPFAADRDRLQIAKEIDLFNQYNREIAQRYGVHYLDITPGTRQAADDHSLLASDGLHPSGKEYARWAEKLVKLVEKQFPPQ